MRHDARLVPTRDLKPYGKDPRRGHVQAIRESLRANGQYWPVVVRRKTSEVLLFSPRQEKDRHASKECEPPETESQLIRCSCRRADGSGSAQDPGRRRNEGANVLHPLR